MSDSGYPRRKVFLAFFLCPFVLGGIGGVIKTFALLAHLVSTPRLLGEVRGGELILMPFLAPFLAQLVFFAPFLLFALTIALLRIRNTALNCLLIALAGAGVATGWVLWFVLLVVNDTEIKSGGIADYSIDLLLVFLASTVTCWLAAKIFLPAVQPDSREPVEH